MPTGRLSWPAWTLSVVPYHRVSIDRSNQLAPTGCTANQLTHWWIRFSLRIHRRHHLLYWPWCFCTTSCGMRSVASGNERTSLCVGHHVPDASLLAGMCELCSWLVNYLCSELRQAVRATLVLCCTTGLQVDGDAAPLAAWSDSISCEMARCLRVITSPCIFFTKLIFLNQQRKSKAHNLAKSKRLQNLTKFIEKIRTNTIPN
jgi:hypothetical protein